MKLEIGRKMEGQPLKARHPSIAIVVPNYNHASFLSESLTSIASQTTAPDEVLIIDDASTDDSVRVITEFIASHPTWKLVRHDERLGVNVTQNEGIHQVQSDWILFLGADDELHPTYLAKVVDQLSRGPDAGLVCACVELIGRTERNNLRPPIIPSAEPRYFPSEMYKRLLRSGDNYHIGTVTLYRRTALMAFGGFDPGLESLADGVLARQIALRYGFSFIPEVLGYWRRHGDNYSVTTVTRADSINPPLAHMRRRIAAEQKPNFEPDYDKRLERRVRFNGARLILLERGVSTSLKHDRLMALLAPGSLDRVLLEVLLRLHSNLALGWLVARMRPMSVRKYCSQFFLRRSILPASERRSS